jgi:NAD(P)-dependent dehydrogenase (short-subunit alcohol dehydrogenase family)
MPAAGCGFEQADNARAVLAAGSLLVVAADVVKAPNDEQQLEPMLDKIEALPRRLGAVQTLLADAGYFSAANVEACREDGLEPLISWAVSRIIPCLVSALRRRSRRKIRRRSRPWPIG